MGFSIGIPPGQTPVVIAILYCRSLPARPVRRVATLHFILIKTTTYQSHKC